MQRLGIQRPHLLLFVYGMVVLCAMFIVGGPPHL